MLLAGAFSLTACDQSSTRSIKAKVDTKATKADDTDTFPPCNDKIVTIADERTKFLDDIKVLFEDSKSHDLDAEQKTKLQKLAIDLKAKSEVLFKEIRKIKTQNVEAKGCKYVDDDNKKVSLSIAKMSVENKLIGARVRALTKEENSLNDDEDVSDLSNPDAEIK